jgi:hypothetical protein
MKSLRLIVLLILFAYPLCAQASLLDWLNRVRAEAGLPACREDGRLARAAADYAARLAASGRLAHRDERGNSALERYRAAGGSATLVGEVLAAAAGPEAAGQAWLASPEHRELLLKTEWSHAGAGFSAWQDLTVYVLMFSAQRTGNLTISPVEEGYRLSGCFLPGLGASRPLLWAGIEMPAPELWDPGTSCFLFRLPAASGGLYCRLGYRSTDGEIVVTDAFIPRDLATFSPGKEPR